ncbi:NAD-dependent protein deacetylase sirtuin-2-like isoform X2 [Dreissena polymorpha]|uniref:NAD-dependent protein deacetylase sirtuin-2-like isoform X2 n=1 Tax=Dreissena polymorpha TaxID=45954 RepID=UPI002263CDCE|nr:NAD-dependent protein deacetylase sirtuin-2-like isoform X2 [Dreissena polymorpha]
MASSQGKVPKSCLHHLEKSPKKELHVTINADHQCFETELYDGEKEWLEEQKKETVTTSTELTEKDKQWFKDYMAFSMGIYFGPQSEPLLDEVTFEGIARYMASDKCTKIVVLAGAGISTSAGIPDFRTPGTGLYDMLKNKYKMDDPQKAFDWNYFMADPKPFFEIRKEKFQGDYKPTPTHYFIKLLENKNKLLRYFTQNIDGLDRQVGLDPRRVTEAHGTMETATCTFCEKQYSKEEMKAQMLVAEDNLVPYCTEEDCGGVIKPDIVMFGENMKPSFAVDSEDVEKCDMMIILGTSLKVPPFNKLPISQSIPCQLSFLGVALTLTIQITKGMYSGKASVMRACLHWQSD